MYKKILVPLDESKRAEVILPHVEELAHRFDAQIVLLKVVEPTRIYATVQGYMPDLGLLREQQNSVIEKRKTYLSGLEGEFGKKNINAKAIVDEAPIVSAIIEVADREGVDLIAMASHGRTGLAHMFYGSVAAGVLHRIDRPLLLIRANG